MKKAFLMGYAFACGTTYGRRIRMAQDVHVKAYMRNGKPVSAHERGAGSSKPVILKRTADSFDGVKNALKDVIDKPLVSADGFVADISKNSIGKILSGKAHRKSISLKIHLAAAANIDHLFQASREGNDSEKGNSPGIRYFRRFYASFRFGGKVYQAKISAREYESQTQGNRIYTIEAIDIEK